MSGRFRSAGLRRNVLALGAVSLLNDAGSEMVIPFLGVFLVTRNRHYTVCCKHKIDSVSSPEAKHTVPYI